MCTTELQALQNKRRSGPRIKRRESKNSKIREGMGKRTVIVMLGILQIQTPLLWTSHANSWPCVLCFVGKKMKNVFFHTTSIHKVCVGGRDLPIICYRVFSFLIVRTYTNYVLEEERNSLTVSLKNVFL